MATATTSFGRDISCTDSLKTGRYATGLRLVAEACYRRLTTPRGSLRGGEDEQNYGFDLKQFVGTTNAKAVAASLPGRIKNELTKDERVETVEVDVLVSSDGIGSTFTITIEVGTADGPFELQIAITDVTVALLGISEAA